MKIVLATRSDAFTRRGGDTVQLEGTRAALQRLGHDVQVSTAVSEVAQHEPDVIHIFNLQTGNEARDNLVNAQSLGVPSALSTIYWELRPAIFMHRLYRSAPRLASSPVSELLYPLGVAAMKLRGLTTRGGARAGDRELIAIQRQIIDGVNVLLPNSPEELDIVARDFHLDARALRIKSQVVPNAIEPAMASRSEGAVSRDLPNDYVLEVGRIEVNKNQLGVMNALMDRPDIPLVFVGRVNETPTDQRYAAELRSLASKRGNTFIIDQIPQHELVTIYRGAAVHVLPSFRESPGLSTLEALFFGSRIVVSDSRFCPIHHYGFDAIGQVCNPFDPKSIKSAVLATLAAPRQAVDPTYFRGFTYDAAAEATVLGYEKALHGRRG